MIRLNNILVATDFSKPSDVALAYGRDLARSYGAALHVLHVAGNAFLLFGGDPATTFVPDQQAEIERTADSRVMTRLEELPVSSPWNCNCLIVPRGLFGGSLASE